MLWQLRQIRAGWAETIWDAMTLLAKYCVHVNVLNVYKRRLELTGVLAGTSRMTWTCHWCLHDMFNVFWNPKALLCVWDAECMFRLAWICPRLLIFYVVFCKRRKKKMHWSGLKWLYIKPHVVVSTFVSQLCTSEWDVLTRDDYV